MRIPDSELACYSSAATVGASSALRSVNAGWDVRTSGVHARRRRPRGSGSVTSDIGFCRARTSPGSGATASANRLETQSTRMWTPQEIVRERGCLGPIVSSLMSTSSSLAPDGAAFVRTIPAPGRGPMPPTAIARTREVSATRCCSDRPGRSRQCVQLVPLRCSRTQQRLHRLRRGRMPSPLGTPRFARWTSRRTRNPAPPRVRSSAPGVWGRRRSSSCGAVLKNRTLRSIARS